MNGLTGRAAKRVENLSKAFEEIDAPFVLWAACITVVALSGCSSAPPQPEGAEASGYRVIVDPVNPQMLHASLSLADRNGSGLIAYLSGVDRGLVSQVEMPHCGGIGLVSDEPGKWRVPDDCRLLEWSIRVEAAERNAVDASKQMSVYFAGRQWWLLAEPTSLLRVDPSGDSSDTPLRIEGLERTAKQVGAVAMGDGAWRVPPGGSAPEFYVFGSLEVRTHQMGTVRTTYVLDDAARFDRLPIAESHAFALEYLTGVFRVSEDLPASDRHLLVVWLGMDETLGEAGGAAGSRSILANYVDGDPDNLEINAARTMLILAHEQVHQLVGLLRSSDSPFPIWLGESLAHYYALKALARGPLPSQVVSSVFDHFIDPTREVAAGLVDLCRRHLQGDPSAYPLFYTQGATFWSELDSALKEANLAGAGLSDVIPALLATSSSGCGLPTEFIALLRKKAGGAIEEILTRYVGEQGESARR